MIWLHIPIVLNVHGVNDVKQAEIHMAEPLVPELSAFEVQMAIEKPYFYMPRLCFFNSAPKKNMSKYFSSSAS